MYGGKLHVNKDTRGFLKWFRVRFFPTSTIMLLPPTMRNDYTRSLKFDRVFVIERKRRSLPLGGFVLFIHLYGKYFNIKPHHFMSNQRICDWINSNDESI